jgi:membrane protein DedA with SNARE-associated domain
MTALVPSVSNLSRRVSWRVVILVLAAIRAAVELLAVFVAPALYHDHFVWLAFLRPTKEVLLTGGFLVRKGDVAVVSLVLAVIPLMIVGVWLFFLLGRAWSSEIQDGSGLPAWSSRILPADRIKALCAVLQERGTTVVFLGRLAVFPSTLLAAAAGASGMDTKEFLVADGLGGLLSIAEVAGAGYLLGRAYHDGKAWITVVGVVVLVAMLVLLGRWLKGQSGKGT